MTRRMKDLRIAALPMGAMLVLAVLLLMLSAVPNLRGTAAALPAAVVAIALAFATTLSASLKVATCPHNGKLDEASSHNRNTPIAFQAASEAQARQKRRPSK